LIESFGASSLTDMNPTNASAGSMMKPMVPLRMVTTVGLERIHRGDHWGTDVAVGRDGGLDRARRVVAVGVGRRDVHAHRLHRPHGP
jgi:hypothetical protein